MHKYTAIITFVLLFSGFSCNKNNDVYSILPNVRVNIYAYLSQPEYFPIGVVGGWMYTNGGSKGIIIYRKNIDEFIAFERHVPHKADESCSLATVDSASLSITEGCDGSVYLINDGSVIDGIAIIGLKQYVTSFDGDLLHIYN